MLIKLTYLKLSGKTLLHFLCFHFNLLVTTRLRYSRPAIQPFSKAFVIVVYKRKRALLITENFVFLRNLAELLRYTSRNLDQSGTISFRKIRESGNRRIRKELIFWRLQTFRNSASSEHRQNQSSFVTVCVAGIFPMDNLISCLTKTSWPQCLKKNHYSHIA